MVNTELFNKTDIAVQNYNILNIVVNTEHNTPSTQLASYYNILNIVVNTELYY